MKYILLVILIPTCLFSQTMFVNDNSVEFGTRGIIDRVRLILPDTIWCAVGQEYNIYFDNVVLVGDYKSYIFKVVCDSGNHWSQRWEYTPKVGASGGFDFELYVYDYYGSLLGADTCRVVVATKSTATHKTILMIGDSLMDQYIYPHEISTLYGDSLIFIGTRDATGDSTANEGRGGKTWAWYESDAASPFVTDGHVNFRAYLTANGFDDPDFVVIGLGTNGTFDESERTAAEITAFLVSADSIINKVVADIPNVKVGVLYVIPPSKEQDSFGQNYQSGYSRGIYRLNMHLYNELFKVRYGTGGTHEHAQVSLIPAHVNIDVEHNMMFIHKKYNARNDSTFCRQSNGVHPGTDGYEQMADTVYGWIVNKW